MVSELIEVRGHIIDSLLLPKILDEIIAAGGSFTIQDVQVGERRVDPSYARIEVVASSPEALEAILGRITQHGAKLVHEEDALLEAASMDGVFPEGFYPTTNLRTSVRLGGRWHEVEVSEMDCGIVWDPAAERAAAVPMHRVGRGQLVVVGHRGIRVEQIARSAEVNVFEFMTSEVSSEKPKGVIVREVAAELKRARAAGEKILWVVGPAVVHTGAGEHLVRLVEADYVQVLFAGNALAAHDIEEAFFGTSLGVSLTQGVLTKGGHEHHLRAINRIRRLGGIAQAVDAGVLTRGVMHACIKAGVEVELAGSIRDDGPLPEVITDCLEAQDRMRQAVRGVAVAILIATELHAIATGNILPASVKTICVDINPAAVTKLTDRGTFQAIGLVTDVEPFLRALVASLLDEAPRSSEG
ncbi:TIGR00300 family protein [Nitrospinae bacterium AH_259_B05_G02_I21]|nr:TIGR00300 family protein [Nitrospinae bacterium AH_259_B05_G02_I21]